MKRKLGSTRGTLRERVLQTRRLTRRLNVKSRMTPNFIIIGAQKSGTTSLYEWLAVHPDVSPALRKEVHYFDINYARPFSWYRSHFPIAKDGYVSGEATPYLLFHPLAPERVARDLANTTRFVAVLREPGSRAISHYWHERRLGIEMEPLPRALELETKRLAGEEERVDRGENSFAHLHFSYLARGLYARQLLRWYEFVDPERLLVVSSESLFTNPAVQHQVLQFLGLPTMEMPFPSLNSSGNHEVPSAETRLMLNEYFREPNGELSRLLGRRLWPLDGDGPLS